MEAEGDMIVLVIIDDEGRVNNQRKNAEPETSESSLEFNNLLDVAEKYGEYISTTKSETSQDDEWDYRKEDFTQEDDDRDYVLSDESDESQEMCKSKMSSMGNIPQRTQMLKPWEQRSFVAELIEKYPEIKDNKKLIINKLAQIMRSVKPPSPPRDYYTLNGIMLECITCGHLSETIPAAARHYQAKHGPRYLVCYSCGVDFRRTGNLYKHEKKCIAPYAKIVLRARAVFLGPKGRSRPYLQSAPDKPLRLRYRCKLCSAVFTKRYCLVSHESLHRGERPFRCHACPCAYTSYSAFAEYLKS